MESTESILLELAADVSHEHNLGIDSMLRLANTLEELNTEANIPCK